MQIADDSSRRRSLYRAVGAGGNRGAATPPDFGRSVNPITSSGGTDYAHQNITLRFLLPIRIGPIIHTVCLYHTISTIMLLHKKLKIC